MPAKIIDGRAIAEEMRADLAPQIEELNKKGITPGLSVVLVGEDPASQVYVRMKGKACEKAGMKSETITMPTEAAESEVLEDISTQFARSLVTAMRSGF